MRAFSTRPGTSFAVAIRKIPAVVHTAPTPLATLQPQRVEERGIVAESSRKGRQTMLAAVLRVHTAGVDVQRPSDDQVINPNPGVRNSLTPHPTISVAGQTSSSGAVRYPRFSVGRRVRAASHMLVQVRARVVSLTAPYVSSFRRFSVAAR